MNTPDLLALIVEGGEPFPGDLTHVCELLRINIGKMKNLRARMDELWQIIHDAGRLLLNEQARCAHLQDEMSKAIQELHECQQASAAKDVRLAGLLKELAR